MSNSEDNKETKYVTSDNQYCETRVLTLEQIHDEVLEGTIDLSDTTIYKLGEEVKINLKLEVVSNGEEG